MIAQGEPERPVDCGLHPVILEGVERFGVGRHADGILKPGALAAIPREIPVAGSTVAEIGVLVSLLSEGHVLEVVDEKVFES